MALETRIAKVGEKVQLDSDTLWTASSGHTFEIGIAGRNIKWTVGTPPPQADYTVEQLNVAAADADLWVKNDGGAGVLYKRLVWTDTNRFYLPGRDLQVNVAAPVEPTEPNSPWRQLSAGANLEQELSKGPISLPRGSTWRVNTTIDVLRDNVAIGAYGSGAKPRIVATGGFRPISVVGKTNFILEGVEVTTEVNDSVEPSIWAYNAPGLTVRRAFLWHGRQGIACQGGLGALIVEDTRIFDCSRQPGDKHGAGIYADKCRPQIRRTMFDTCGWRPGYMSRDSFSHGLYEQGTCLDGALLEDVFFYNCSSHGFQARAGGTVRNVLTLDCPIGFSYGLVNGSMIHKGGVTGTLQEVWVVGCPPISTNHKPGWAGEFGNVKSATANRLFAGDDDLGVNPAFIVHRCDGIQNPPEVGIVQLHMKDLGSTFKQGTYDGRDGVEATSVTLKSVPAKSLRAALGPNFVADARKDVSTAAQRGIDICRSAWGV